MNKEQFIESGIFEEMTLTSAEQSTQTMSPSSPAVSLADMSSSSSFSPEQALATSTPSVSVSRVSEYKEYDSCEELEMINGSGRWIYDEITIL